jgi:hypothetical protein
MGKNNKARRAANKRKKEMRRKPEGWYQPPLLWSDNVDTGKAVELDAPPFEYLYEDEPDFLTKCASCGTVNGIPMFTIAFTKAFIAEYGEPETIDALGNQCPSCGERIETPPRVETGPDGRTHYITDRESLIAAGVTEWHEEVWGLSLEKDGVGYQLAMASGAHDVLVVCDDCGLPFIARVANTAITTLGEEKAGLSMQVGPCEHCREGFGRPLVYSVSDGQFRTVSTSREFASNVLAVLAEDLQSGKIDLAVAARELRQHGGTPYRMLADWIEARPANAVVASAVLGALAPLLVGQVSGIINDDDEKPSQQEQPVPAKYTEDQVADIVEKVLHHYDRKIREADHEQKRDSKNKDRAGKDETHSR